MNKLVIDRTEADVLNRTKKGYYNLEDISRVMEYVSYICDYIGIVYDLPQLNSSSYLTKEKMQDIINIIEDIKEHWVVKKDLPPTPIVTYWDYKKANTLESILSMLYDFTESLQIDGLYSGTFNAGDHLKIIGDKR